MTDAPSSDEKFYGDAVKYWGAIPATVDGMLGGYGHISNVDVTGSLAFVGPRLEVRISLVFPNVHIFFSIPYGIHFVFL